MNLKFAPRIASRRLACCCLFLVGCIPALVASDAKPSRKSETVQMLPYKVTERPFDGFSISYGVRYVLWGPVDDVSFEDVDAGSLPAKRGIKSGDRLLTIGGLPVKGMKRRDFERRFFRTREVLVVEVRSPGTTEVRKIELQFDPDSWEKDGAATRS